MHKLKEMAETKVQETHLLNLVNKIDVNNEFTEQISPVRRLTATKVKSQITDVISPVESRPTNVADPDLNTMLSNLLKAT